MFGLLFLDSLSLSLSLKSSIFCFGEREETRKSSWVASSVLENQRTNLTSCLKTRSHQLQNENSCRCCKGLAYLHDKASPPVIYRNLKCSNILLDKEYNPKLSDFGLAKLGPVGDKTHVSTRVMGTYGYCAPEYAMTGQLTLKSDVYSLGVVLLEIITGRKAVDNSKAVGEHNLVAWPRPLFRHHRKFSQMADPMLQGQYPARGLYQALVVAAMCAQEQPKARPVIADVVEALTYLASQMYEHETATFDC